MSRLSRANLKARESVFAGGPELYRGDTQAICPPSLEECVFTMLDCCEEECLELTNLCRMASGPDFAPGLRGTSITSQRDSGSPSNEKSFGESEGMSVTHLMLIVR